MTLRFLTYAKLTAFMCRMIPVCVFFWLNVVQSLFLPDQNDKIRKNIKGKKGGKKTNKQKKGG